MKKDSKFDLFAAYLTNRDYYCEDYDLPYANCKLPSDPDWIALYPNKKEYSHTDNTLVVFCVDDHKFDGFNKLFWAIAFRKEALLSKWKERFQGVKYVAAPDYSVYRDMPYFWQISNIAKSRIVML